MTLHFAYWSRNMTKALLFIRDCNKNYNITNKDICEIKCLVDTIYSKLEGYCIASETTQLSSEDQKYIACFIFVMSHMEHDIYHKYSIHHDEVEYTSNVYNVLIDGNPFIIHDNYSKNRNWQLSVIAMRIAFICDININTIAAELVINNRRITYENMLITEESIIPA